MYYVLGFMPTTQRITFFFATEKSEEATRERYTERIIAKDGSQDEEIVSINAPDLYAVYQNHPQYFVRFSDRNLIKDCFFCRAYLGNDSPNMMAVDYLTREAKRHGHCLLCHRVYPVMGLDGGMYIAAALRSHSMDCTARDPRNSPQ